MSACCEVVPPSREAMLADEHWRWLGPTLEKMFKDAFVHGYKHGRDSK